MNVTLRPSGSAEFRKYLPQFLLFTAVFCLLMAFIVWYVNREKYIYFWDYATYHNYYIDLGNRFRERPFKTLGQVVTSIRKREYNFLPTLLLIPFRLVFGPSRLAYILAVSVTFAFPAIVLFSVLIGRLNGRSKEQTRFDVIGTTLIALLALALLPQLWVPVLLGYSDVVGLVVIFLVLLLYFGRDFSEQSSRALWRIGLLLSLVILLRRWYAYWVVGFFAALIMCEAWKCLQAPDRRERFALISKNILKVAVIAAVSFVVIATPIAWRMLTTDWRDDLSAYQRGHSLMQHLGRLYDYFGLPMVMLVGLGVASSLIKRERRGVAFFLFLQFAVTYVLFTRVQDIDLHHYNWVLATLMIFVAFFVQDVFLWVKRTPAKVAVLAVFLAFGVANFLIMLAPGADAPFKQVAFALPKLRFYPKTRTDWEQMHALLGALDGVSQGAGSTVYVLASSLGLNAGIVYDGCFAFEPEFSALAGKILPASNVDKRDGFPFQLLKADYVVLTVPIGYHLAPDDQRVIGILADQLIRNVGIGKAYEKLDYEFRLEGGNAYVYKKARPFDAAELRKLSDEFLQFYPNDKEKFEIKPQLIREVSASNG